MDVFLGIDLGTSYFKLGLFDRSGELLGLGRVATPTTSGKPGWREIPVKNFWSALRKGRSEALRKAKCSAEEIRGVSYASQANTFVLLDENNQPITPLILWTDARVPEPDPTVAEFQRDPIFLRVTGLGIPTTTTMAVMKLKWFQQTQPGLWRRARRVMSISDYLTFCLTGQTVGDAGTASLLGLLNLPELDWGDDALQTAGLRREQMSTPLRPGTKIGNVTKKGTEYLGVPPGAGFTIGSLDHHLAALGAGVGQNAPISISLGTVLACLACSSQYAPKTNCIMGPAVEAGRYYQIAFDDNGASMLQWYRDTFAPKADFAELTAAAEIVSPGCDGLVFEDKKFRGETPSHTQGHFVRAIMESTARTARQLMESLCDTTKKPAQAVATGGGAQSELWLSILRDTTGVEFIPAPCLEAAARGAAMLARGK